MCDGRGMGRRSTGWDPPHCPNPNCTYFNALRDKWPYKRKGFYRRLKAPDRVQRFTCLACNRTFSVQTFSTDYWQKLPKLGDRMFLMVVGCMANRQMARALGCSPSTVAHQIARLGRHCLLYHSQELARIHALGEIAIDGFESFEWSQYFPFHHNIAVDVQSGYFLFHTDSPLRRKGRMTVHQKARRTEIERALGRPSPHAIEEGMYELLQTVTTNHHVLTVRSDDHRAYPRAIRKTAGAINHRITSSKERRDSGNPLWEINVADLMIRHSLAPHKRETIAWVKRRQASVEKLVIFQVWRNCIKKRREKGPRVTSAMLIGLHRRPVRVRDILVGRLFFERVRVPERWKTYYCRGVETAALPVNRRHTLRYAF